MRLDELEGELVSYSVALVEQYRKPSRNDCFALALAKHHQCPLLTGDKDLRAAAENEAVVVMGTVWLLKQLVILQLITADEARTSLTLMKNAGRRLPWRRAEEYILDELTKVPQIKNAYITFGAYDIMAEIHGETQEEFENTVSMNIRHLSRVVSTMTLNVMNS